MPRTRLALLVALVPIAVACAAGDGAPPATASPGGAPDAGADAPRACTMIGCEDGLQVRLEPAPAGAFRVEARVGDAEAPPAVAECADGGCGGSVFLPGFTASSALLRILVDGRIVERAVEPVYEDVRPNGPGCPPTCRQATVTVDVSG